MLRAALHNLGCKVNAYETEVMEEMLIENGYEIVDFDDIADVYVINTCSVTNIADRKSRQMIHKAARKNENACIVAAGCYVQTAIDEAVNDPDIDIIIGNNEKNKLIPLLNEFFKNKGKVEAFKDLTEAVPYEEMLLPKTHEHTRAFIKVQDGCNQFCTYCIIPYARGRIRSRSIDDVLSEVKALAENGYKEIVVTGIHISSYGKDTDSSLIELLESIDKVEGIERIRIGSLEPMIITKEFVERLVKTKVTPHFHLSLQSGSDAVLKRMNRHYSAKEYYNGVELLREYYEHPAITTDIILGFPGETLDEFEETCDFVRHVKFFETHLFKYSKRKGTPAATMPNQILEAEKARRSHILSEIQNKYKKEFMEFYIGKPVEILVENTEEIDGVKYYVGLNREYVRFLIPRESNELIINEFTTVIAESFLNSDSLLAKISL